ncbi:2-phosphosulfolactate phosphatase [Halosquirtibacter xylanolyticus]|uniref:2-phosphosulfolactate phosphatase n=1 Tax=Halosquirtibacter xylanolyticus TaxID=3374599 RepID=UPI003749B9B7|nr:2-phosphosulfolactate phosphatase [Prolixibacteraceae bacterium]
MNIKILQGFDGAVQAEGLAVIIDVFRAFSFACYAANNGAEKIYPIDKISLVDELYEKLPNSIRCGERHERKVEHFDFGNSPTHIEHENFKGKTILHSTSSGTQGVYLSRNATEKITGSFVNAQAVVEYIKQKQPETVSLCCMGYEGTAEADEDTLFAIYIKNELEGRENHFDKMVEKLRLGSGKRLFDPLKQSFSPKRDFELCLSLNRFSFVLKAQEDEFGYYLERIDI